MSTLEQNKEIVQRIVNEFWRAGNARTTHVPSRVPIAR
jgi:hypothetical protein